MITLLVAAQLTLTPVPCPTPQPGPAGVCQEGRPAEMSEQDWTNFQLRYRRPAPTPDTRPAFCDPRPNPYERPDLAAQCSAWDAEHQPRPPLPEFVSQATYRDPYDDARILVLAVTATLEGVPLVVAQRIRPIEMAGMVFCFRVDSPEAQRWSRVN